jgi:hypothetical protein
MLKLEPQKQPIAQNNIVLIAETQVYMKCLGLSSKSSVFRSLCKSKSFPAVLSLLEDDQIVELHSVLKYAWASLPADVQNWRSIVSGQLEELGLSWDNQAIEEWVRRQGTRYTALSAEQLEKLSSKLRKLSIAKAS